MRAHAARQIPRRAVSRRSRPDVAARFHHGPLTARRNCDAADVAAHVDELWSNLRPIAGNRDVDRAALAACQVEQIQIRAVLKNNLALTVRAGPDRRPLDVELRELRDLPVFFADPVVRPDVEAVFRSRVGHVVKHVAVPHRLRVGPRPAGDALGAVVLQVEQPDVGRHAAAITLPGAVIRGVQGVRQPLAVGADGRVRSIGHGQFLGQTAAGCDREELCHAREGRFGVREEYQPAVRRKVAQILGRRVVRHTKGHATGHRQRVQIGIAVIVSHERDCLPVAAEARKRLHAGRTG